MVAVAGVMETDPNLENPLVEPADRTALGVPLVFDRFGALVELPRVEEADPLQHPRRERPRTGIDLRCHRRQQGFEPPPYSRHRRLRFGPQRSLRDQWAVVPAVG